MKKLAILLLCLNIARGYSQVNEPIKEVDEKRSFEYEGYSNLMMDSFTDLETKSIYRMYDLDNDGLPDSEAVFGLDNIYMDDKGKIQVIPSKKAKIVIIKNKKTNEKILYMDTDKNGTLETKMVIPSSKDITSA
jgi:hypothetical protein